MEQVKGTLTQSEFVRLPFYIFELFGIIFFKHKTCLQKFIFAMCVLNVFVNVTLIQCYPVFVDISNPVEFTAYICYETYILNSFIKVTTIWIGRFNIYKIFTELDKYFPKSNKEITEYRLWEHYKEIAFLRRLYKFQLLSTTMFGFFPIVQSLFEYMIWGGDFMFTFPYTVYYPFDPTQPILYPWIYMYQMICGYILACLLIAVNILIVIMVHLICMHLKYLTNVLTNLEFSSVNDNIEELKRFIKYHDNILSLSEKINEVFSISIWMDYFATVAVICMISFRLAIVGTEIWDLIKFFLMLALSLTYVYLICYFGTKLLQASSDLSFAVYSHRWYQGNTKYKKMLILIMQRADKPVFLSAFKFFVVSMESFQMLMKVSYQFFTLLRSTYNVEK